MSEVEDRPRIPAQLRIDNLSKEGMIRQQREMVVGLWWMYCWRNIHLSLIHSFLLPFIKDEFKLNPVTTSLVISVRGVGDVLGSLASGVFTDLIGRRRVTVVHQILLGVATVSCALAPGFLWLCFWQLVGGYAQAVGSTTEKVYVAEVIPSKNRGKVLYLIMLGTIFPVAQYMAIPALTYGWRLMALIGGVMTLTSTIAMHWVPESPRWLQSRGRWDKADKILSKLEAQSKVPPIRPDADEVYKLPEKEKADPQELFIHGYWKRTIPLWSIWLGHFHGMRAISYLMPVIIWPVLGPALAAQVIFWSSWISPATQLIVALGVVERYQRWRLMLLGFSLQAVVLLAWPFSGSSMWLILLMFVLWNSIGPLTTMFWTYTSEVYPTRIRGLAYGVASGLGKIGSVYGPIVVALLSPFGYAAAFVWGACTSIQQFLSALPLPRKTTGLAVEKIAE